MQYGYVVNIVNLLTKDIFCENDLLTLTNIRKVQKLYLLVRIVNDNINCGVSQSNIDSCSKGGNQK